MTSIKDVRTREMHSVFHANNIGTFISTHCIDKHSTKQQITSFDVTGHVGGKSLLHRSPRQSARHGGCVCGTTPTSPQYQAPPAERLRKIWIFKKHANTRGGRARQENQSTKCLTTSTTRGANRSGCCRPNAPSLFLLSPAGPATHAPRIELQRPWALSGGPLNSRST